jgi:hypothetical protein
MAKKLLLTLAVLVVVYAFAYARNNPDKQVTLPNGFILSGIRPWFGPRREDLLTADGLETLSTDIEFVCFDDRYVFVIPMERGQGGLFDSTVQARVLAEDHPQVFTHSGLKRPGVACNGYYTAVLGPGLLYGEDPPFQPSCDSVNRANLALKDAAWMNRPCDDR